MRHKLEMPTRLPVFLRFRNSVQQILFFHRCCSVFAVNNFQAVELQMAANAVLLFVHFSLVRFSPTVLYLRFLTVFRFGRLDHEL
jgi:hypothetical protein